MLVGRSLACAFGLVTRTEVGIGLRLLERGYYEHASQREATTVIASLREA
jgi:hypothetical protein